MKLTTYSKSTLLVAVDIAIDRQEQSEKRIMESYIKLNPCDSERRKRDTELIMYAFSMARLSVKEELKKTFKELETLNKQ